MNKDNFAAVILAAGYSSRMRDFKPLMKFGEYTAIETIVNTFTTSGICNIIVVVGHRGKELIDVLKDSQAKCIENKNYSQGMYSSVLKGIEALNENVSAFFMLPVDIPLVKIHTIETLKSQYLCCDKGIIYPTFNGKRGHPPLIDCKYKDIILKNNEYGGLKNILSKFDDDSINVPVFDKFTIMDMDTKADYIELLKYFSLKVPNREECYSILKMHDVSDNVIRHCVKVSEIATYILNILNEKGYNFDEDLLSAAALLHDIDRKSTNHAKKGEETLKKLGYEHIGNIISTHMDIKVGEKENITENEILYLADKLVKEDKVMPLECRFDRCLLKHKNDFEAEDKIKQRYIEAKKVISKIEAVIGKSFDYE
ncbi:DVU_1551 family NTP transferase [Clostridium aciditolerans]|uniref:NTP transferase domain-containing protein n=1 Tax=Clostridium aciditolerans TaxID=339861 RepID=A0A934HXS7_9CLOT|nr:NTP transferase domain-containing protein [Clostridium aciditolerans]